MAEPSVRAAAWPSRMSLPGSTLPTYKAWCASARAAEGGVLSAAQGRRSGGSAKMAAERTGDERTQDRSAAGDRGAGGVHPQGSRSAGVPPDVVRGFSEEFLAGMAADASRSRRLGDIGANAPSEWVWGGRPDCVPHVLLMLYAREGGLEAWAEAVRGPIGMPGSASRPASTPSTWARSSRSASPTG